MMETTQIFTWVQICHDVAFFLTVQQIMDD